MSNRISSLIKKKLVGKSNNLVSFDNPCEVMRYLLRKHQITGIIDAGASDGRISKRLLRRFPQAHVYAFEPNPLYCELLQKYARKEPRFHPYFVAISDYEGTANLYLTHSPGGTSLFAPAKRLSEIDQSAASVKNLEKVDVVTIDQWAKRHGDIGIQLMKFDIQAGELKAIRGAAHVLLNSTLLVYTEIWFNPAYEGGALYSEVDASLRQYDFILYDVFKPKYNPNNKMLTLGNAIFIKAHAFGL